MLPPSRTIAGAAIGSREQSSTSRSLSFRVIGAVAAGTSSRSAIKSHSPAQPVEGPRHVRRRRPVGGTVAGLVARPDPHGHGCRGPTAPSAAAVGGLPTLGAGLFPMPGGYRPEPLQHVRRAVGDDRLRRRVLAELEVGLAVDGPDVHRGRPPRCRPSPGWSRSSLMPGPMIQPGSTIRRSIGQWCAFSTSITSSSSGASRLTRCSAVNEKLITRTGEPVAGPAELGEQLDQPTLDQPAVPGRVLGLDRQLDPAVAVGDGLQQLAQGEHPAQLGVGSGASSSRSAHGFFQDAKSSSSSSASSIVETSAAAAAVRRRLRSCTQTRWPSAVSRTSHSSPSAPASSAAT